MMQLLRWQWVLPRLTLVVVVLMGASYVLGIAARSAAIRKGEQIFGSAVSVSHARVPLVNGRVQLSGLTVSNPNGTGGSWLAADFCELDVALKPLMNGQLMFDRGRVHGLRFDGGSQASNEPAATATGAASKSMFGDDADAKATAWLSSLDERFGSDVAKQFESMKRIDALSARCAKQTASLQKRASELQKRAETLQLSVNAADANRLRHTTTINDTPAQVAAIREEIRTLSSDFAKLPEQLESERREIVAARRQDEQLLREQMKFESIQQEAITAYFLRQQVSSSVKQLVGWLRCGRKLASSQRSDVVVRNLEFQGKTHLLGQTVDVRGLLTGFATKPMLMAEPMRMRMKTAGASPLQVRVTFDCRQPVAHDELFVDCREFPLPGITLGGSDELRLKLSPSVGSLTVSVRIDGDQIAGDVQLVQKQLRITSLTGGELNEVPLAEPLQTNLADVNSLATHFTLRGTADAPACTLWSNLGPAVAEAMDRALVRCGEEHAAQVLAESRRQVDERLAALERQVADQQAKFASGTGSLPQRLDTIARQQTRRERISVERLGGRLPNSSLFRR